MTDTRQALHDLIDDYGRSMRALGAATAGTREDWIAAATKSRVALDAALSAQPVAGADAESKAMFVARLENMREHGDTWLTIPAVLALLNDCDMLASQAAPAPEPSAQGEPVAWLQSLHERINTLAALSLKSDRYRLGGELKAEISARIASAPSTPPPAVVEAVPLAVTDEMVESYLRANSAYWQQVDAMPRDITKPWRQGTPSEATRVSLEAALGIAPKAAQPVEGES